MKTVTRYRIRAIAALLLAVLSLLLAIALSGLTVMRARMPYNSEGRFFDGLVVHHAGTEFVYGGLAVLFWVLTVVCCVWATRTVKRIRTDPH